MGRFLLQTLQREGCDISQVQRRPAAPDRAVLLGLKDRDTFPLIFYRENCADMAVDGSDFDEAFIASVAALLITGTHFSTAARAAARARGARPRAAARRAHGARHRLPAGAVGPHQARRRRDPLRRERRASPRTCRRSCRSSTC